MGSRSCAAACLLFFTASQWSAAGEGVLLKPVGGPGQGKVVDGLQVRMKAVKKEFGPGESVLMHWTIVNVGGQPKQIRLDAGRRSLSQFTFAARRNGRSVKLARRGKGGAGGERAIRLAPGSKRSLWIDLRSVDWTERSWLNPLGDYEVSVTYGGAEGGRPLTTGWVAFRLAQPGTPLPRPDDPEEVERIRRLIAQLGAEEFQKREEAEREILKIGKKALGLLQEVLTTTEDAEIRLRCKKLMKRIRSGGHQHHGKQALCRVCRERAFTTDIGRCRHCRGHTPSGSWVSCRACAIRLGRCAACGNRLGGPIVRPRPRPRPRPLPPPAPAPRPRPGPPIDEEF
jgi:hypothetical protein